MVSMTATPTPTPQPESTPLSQTLKGIVGRLDRFQLGAEIGRGAMGRVHRAWDPMLRRVVAIKILLNDDPIQMMHFLREAQLQASVDHPNVCKVYEVGTGGEQPYITMQLIEGETLNQLQGTLTVQQVVEVMADAASGVHAAHQRGLIHRDIKPSNILLEPQPDGSHRAYIMDFGLARDLGNTEPNISWGLVGTPAYMSPEQVKGVAIGPASDIYSMGATLYAALTGVPPRDPDAARHEKDMRLLRRVRPGVSRELECILKRCMELEPVDRYPSAAALEQDLRAWLNGTVISACSGTPRHWILRTARRHRPLLILGCASLLALIGITSWLMHVRRRDQWLADRIAAYEVKIGVQHKRLRCSRMMPAQDIRPAIDQMKSLIGEVENDMRQVGRASHGKGHYVIGRVYLEVGDYAKAERQLEMAWESGLRSKDLSAALGMVLARRHIEEGGLREERIHESSPQAQARLKRISELMPYLTGASESGIDREDIELANAYLALVRRDFPGALTICRKLSTEEPWFYEALLCEALVLEQQIGAKGFNDAFLLERSRSCVEKALNLARSDDRVYAAMIRLHTRLGIQADKAGQSSVPHYQRAHDQFRMSEQVRPDSPEASEAMLALLRLTLDVRLEQGQDLRPELRRVLDRFRPVIDRGISDAPGLMRDVLALAGAYTRLQARFGEDPRPWLDWAARHLNTFDPTGWLENRLAYAMFLTEWNLDPAPTFESIFKRVDRLVVERPFDTSLFMVQGRAWAAHARWLRERGVDDTPSLARSAGLLATLVDLPGGACLARSDLARVLAGQALAKAESQGFTSPDLQKALALLQPGKCTNVQDYQALADVKLATVKVGLICHQRTPITVVEEGLQATQKALLLAPASVDLHALRAELALVAARETQMAGGSPANYLKISETAVRNGYALNRNAASIHLANARLATFRTLMGRDVRVLEEGLSAAVLARQLLPERIEVQWIHGLLDGLKHSESSRFSDAAALAKKNPAAVAFTRAVLPDLPLELSP